MVKPLDVNPEIRKAIAQEVKAFRNSERDKAKRENEKLAIKTRGDELRNNINMERLLNHDDKLYFEEVFKSL